MWPGCNQSDLMMLQESRIESDIGDVRPFEVSYPIWVFVKKRTDAYDRQRHECDG